MRSQPMWPSRCSACGAAATKTRRGIPRPPIHWPTGAEGLPPTSWIEASSAHSLRNRHPRSGAKSHSPRVYTVKGIAGALHPARAISPRLCPASRAFPSMHGGGPGRAVVLIVAFMGKRARRSSRPWMERWRSTAGAADAEVSLSSGPSRRFPRRRLFSPPAKRSVFSRNPLHVNPFVAGDELPPICPGWPAHASLGELTKAGRHGRRSCAGSSRGRGPASGFEDVLAHTQGGEVIGARPTVMLPETGRAF
jgi:hypothetical protein